MVFLSCLQSIALAFERCVLRGLAAWQKLSIFKATEHHGMKEEAWPSSTDPFRGGTWSCFSCLPQITGTPPPHAEFERKRNNYSSGVTVRLLQTPMFRKLDAVLWSNSWRVFWKLQIPSAACVIFVVVAASDTECCRWILSTSCFASWQWILLHL